MRPASDLVTVPVRPDWCAGRSIARLRWPYLEFRCRHNSRPYRNGHLGRRETANPWSLKWAVVWRLIPLLETPIVPVFRERLEPRQPDLRTPVRLARTPFVPVHRLISHSSHPSAATPTPRPNDRSSKICRRLLCTSR